MLTISYSDLLFVFDDNAYSSFFDTFSLASIYSSDEAVSAFIPSRIDSDTQNKF